MKVPIKPKMLTKFKLGWKYVILHDVSCNFEGLGEFYTDNVKAQINRLRTADYIMNGQNDINFHYLIERLDEDYEVVIGRPLSAMCEYDDIPDNINRTAVHVGMMGNFNYKIPGNRFYQQMAYKIISPLVQQYHIQRDRILLHDEVSIKEDLECPGKLFDKQKLLAMVYTMFVSF